MTSQNQTNGQCPVCNGDGRHAFRNRDLMFDGKRLFDYHQCVDCNAVFQHPMPELEEIASFYPDTYTLYRVPKKVKFPSPVERAILKKYDGYAHLQTTHVQDLVSPFARLLARQKRIKYIHPIQYIKNGAALDIGCGNGKFLLQLRQLGWQVKGIEFNEGAVKVCKSNGLDVFRGDLMAARFPDESFDLVTAHHLVEHLRDPITVFHEISRIVKPGGQILIRTPNSASLGRSWFGKYWFADDVPRHLVLYNPVNLTRLAEKNGFSLEFMSVLPYTNLLLYSFDYLIDNRGKPSHKSKLRKLIVSPYYLISRLLSKGDEIHALYRKK